MNTFAWNIILNWNKVISGLDFDYVANLSKTWDKIMFIFGDTELNSTAEIIDMIEDKLWDLKSYDISVSSEDKIEIINDTYEEWVYEIATYEWEQVDFEEIIERFEDFDEVVSIREWEISEKFWNKVVKVDFVY